jgi:single-strand DNA-binding protein
MVKTILFVKVATNGFPGHNTPKKFSFFLLKNLTLKRNKKGRRLLTSNFPSMRGVNRVMLIGNLGKDPDTQHLEGHIAVAKFPLATTETFKDRSGKLISQTEWHTVVLWRGLAELAQKYLHKGSLVYIEGRLRTRSWEDKEGNKKFATEVVGDNLIMLDKRTDATHGSHGPAATQHGENIEGFSADVPPLSDSPSQDLPF